MASTSPTGVPASISNTPGMPTAPVRVTSIVPGASGDPACRNQAEPYRAMSATWASVSTFATRVGRRATPRSNGRGGVTVGLASPPLSQLISAVSSLATYRRGSWLMVMGTSDRPASPRSCTADQTVCTCAARVWSRHTCTAVAPTARAASTAPSSTRCGARLSRAWSFSLAGSLSMPLATTTADPAGTPPTSSSPRPGTRRRHGRSGPPRRQHWPGHRPGPAGGARPWAAGRTAPRAGPGWRARPGGATQPSAGPARPRPGRRAAARGCPGPPGPAGLERAEEREYRGGQRDPDQRGDPRGAPGPRGRQGQPPGRGRHGGQAQHVDGEQHRQPGVGPGAETVPQRDRPLA